MNRNDQLARSIDAALRVQGTDWRQIAMAAGVTPSELESGLDFFGEADRLDLQQHLDSYENDVRDTIELAASTAEPIPPYQECRDYFWSIAVRSRDELLSSILERAAEYELVGSAGSARVGSGVIPLEDRVLIKPLEMDQKSESGIYLPESAKEKPMQGKIIAVGPGRLLDNGERVCVGLKKGDTVVFANYAGTEVAIKSVRHLLIRESELLGIIEA